MRYRYMVIYHDHEENGATLEEVLNLHGAEWEVFDVVTWPDTHPAVATTRIIFRRLESGKFPVPQPQADGDPR